MYKMAILMWKREFKSQSFHILTTFYSLKILGSNMFFQNPSRYFFTSFSSELFWIKLENSVIVSTPVSCFPQCLGSQECEWGRNGCDVATPSCCHLFDIPFATDQILSLGVFWVLYFKLGLSGFPFSVFLPRGRKKGVF